MQPFRNGMKMFKDFCITSLTNRIYQHLVLHYMDGFDAEGTPYVNLWLRLRLAAGVFEAPWRHHYHIRLDATPLKFVNGQHLGDVYMVPILFFDETSYGTYEFYCRPHHGQHWEPSADPLRRAAGLSCNGGLPGKWSCSENVVTDTTRVTGTTSSMPAFDAND